MMWPLGWAWDSFRGLWSVLFLLLNPENLAGSGNIVGDYKGSCQRDDDSSVG